VWLNNAKDLLIRTGKSKYDTISTRDDVMTTLIAKGVKPLLAFKTMEYVRKGKAAKKGLEPEMKEAMTKAGSRIGTWIPVKRLSTCSRRPMQWLMF
jgi:DNA polymerase-3 subunit alpha (Gram-positive type)